MGSNFSLFLSRFDNHRSKIAPLGKALHPTFDELYLHVGVGWFKGNLIHILEPAIINDLKSAINSIKRLQNKLPFAYNSIGNLFLFDQSTLKIEFFDFTNNSLQPISDNLDELFNEILYKNDFHLLLNASLNSQLSASLGPLTTSEVYQASLPLLLGGEKVVKNFSKVNFLTYYAGIAPIILQWESFEKS